MYFIFHPTAESEEQRNELNFERESRVRLERELKKETQSRSLVEQELQLTKKQYEVFMKLKEQELHNQKQELEKQWMAAKSQEQKDTDDRLRQVTLEYQQQDARQQEEHRQQIERKDKQVQLQLETMQLQVTQLTTEKQELSNRLDSANDRLYDLERELQTASAGGAATGGDSEIGLAEEEKHIYVQQIEMLQAQVKELEEEKFQRVQDVLNSGRLASPSSSPRSSKAKSFGGECEHCADLEEERKEMKAKEEAAERTLALAQEIKREAEGILKNRGGGSANAPSSDTQEDRERLTSLFKEAVNEMFFRFQDYFEEEAALDSKQVLMVIRKVLKQSTKDVIQKLHDPEEEDAADDASDGPPAPPSLEDVVVAAAETAAADPTTTDQHVEQKPPAEDARSTSTASVVDEDSEPASLFMEKVVDRLQHHTASDSSDDDEEEDDFED